MRLKDGFYMGLELRHINVQSVIDQECQGSRESCSAGAMNKADVWREVQIREKNIDFLIMSKIIYKHSSFRRRISD